MAADVLADDTGGCRPRRTARSRAARRWRRMRPVPSGADRGARRRPPPSAVRPLVHLSQPRRRPPRAPLSRRRRTTTSCRSSARGAPRRSRAPSPRPCSRRDRRAAPPIRAAAPRTGRSRARAPRRGPASASSPRRRCPLMRISSGSSTATRSSVVAAGDACQRRRGCAVGRRRGRLVGHRPKTRRRASSRAATASTSAATTESSSSGGGLVREPPVGVAARRRVRDERARRRARARPCARGSGARRPAPTRRRTRPGWRRRRRPACSGTGSWRAGGTPSRARSSAAPAASRCTPASRSARHRRLRSPRGALRQLRAGAGSSSSSNGGTSFKPCQSSSSTPSGTSSAAAWRSRRVVRALAQAAGDAEDPHRQSTLTSASSAVSFTSCASACSPLGSSAFQSSPNALRSTVVSSERLMRSPAVRVDERSADASPSAAPAGRRP